MPLLRATREQLFLAVAERRLFPLLVEVRDLKQWPRVDVNIAVLLDDVLAHLGFDPVARRRLLGAAAWALIGQIEETRFVPEE